MLREEEGGEEREQNVMELVTSAALFAETAPEPTLSAFLNELALVSDLDNYDADSDAVVLMRGSNSPLYLFPGSRKGCSPARNRFPRGTEHSRRNGGWLMLP